MTSPSRDERRRFLRTMSTTIAGFFGLAAFGKVAKAATGSGVFASQFLEEGRVIDLPAGYYDPEQKVFIQTDSGRPMVAQQMTGVWTCSYQTKCTNMWYPKDGAPSCTAYDQDLVRHPDGFRPGDAGSC